MIKEPQMKKNLVCSYIYLPRRERTQLSLINLAYIHLMEFYTLKIMVVNGTLYLK
jgi:hypothetical protein